MCHCGAGDAHLSKTRNLTVSSIVDSLVVLFNLLLAAMLLIVRFKFIDKTLNVCSFEFCW